MIIVVLNEDKYAYDIHSLVKAFYPQQEVKVFVEGTKELRSDPGLPAFFVLFEKEAIRVKAWQEAESQEKTEPEADREQKDGRQLLWEEQIFLSCPQDRIAVKNELKRLLYKMLSELTQKELRWGALTGIRPVKMAMQLLEQGQTEEQIRRFMRENYLVSEQKAALSTEIARRERRILSDIHYENGYSLYVGIPFCPTTCLYCSFTSFPISAWKKRVSEYLDALETELDFVRETFSHKILDSVYIGGGTPTTLEPEELDRLLSAICGKLNLTDTLEFTVEAGRADSITREKLKVLKKHGVSRISVNPQTMNQRTLDLIGRRHTVEQVREAFLLAREEGFDNINMDLILGLPGEGIEEVSHTMEQVRALGPDNLTVHSLAIKRASRLSQWILENGQADLNNTDATMALAEKTARGMGMSPYYLYRQKNMSGNFENVGYAAPGKAGIYNILIMEEKEDIVALGAGVISKRVYPDGRIERCDSVKEVAQYIERIGEMIERKRVLFRD